MRRPRWRRRCRGRRRSCASCPNCMRPKRWPMRARCCRSLATANRSSRARASAWVRAGCACCVRVRPSRAHCCARARSSRCARRSRHCRNANRRSTIGSPACATSCLPPNSSARTRSARPTMRTAASPNSRASCRASRGDWIRRAPASNASKRKRRSLSPPSTPAAGRRARRGRCWNRPSGKWRSWRSRGMRSTMSGARSAMRVKRRARPHASPAMPRTQSR